MTGVKCTGAATAAPGAGCKRQRGVGAGRRPAAERCARALPAKRQKTSRRAAAHAVRI